MDITKRIDINLGYTCNADCPFCYYKLSKQVKQKKKDLTTFEAKRLLCYIKKKGKEIVDFTGGEPTIREDIFELVAFAKRLGFTEISIITNGLKLADKNFLKNLVAAGVNDILFSVHGYTSEMHDELVGVQGAFEKLTHAMNNAKQIGTLRMRSNTVVNGLNFKYVFEITELLHSLGVQHVNFILFNPIVEAVCVEKEVNVRYSEASPYLKQALDAFQDKFERITIRYLPFCFLPGYEEHITECPQIQYDPFEWDYLVRMRIRNGILLSSLATLIGLLLLPNVKRIVALPIPILLREAIMRGLSFKNKVKGNACRQCAFDYICDGLWREYAKRNDFAELRSIPGKKIIDPVYFLRTKDQGGIQWKIKR